MHSLVRKRPMFIWRRIAFEHDPNKKAKGRDDLVHLLRQVHHSVIPKVTEKVAMTEVLKAHVNLLVKVR